MQSPRLIIAVAAIALTTVAAIAQEPPSVQAPHLGRSISGDESAQWEPSAWPWQAVGRVNIADAIRHRHCTGTLVGPRLVLTAGHCVFDHRMGRWALPQEVHFVAGQAGDHFAGHATAVAIIRAPQFRAAGSDDPREAMPFGQVAYDWALIRLETELPIRPVPVKVIANQDFAQELAGAEIARGGYSADRKYGLSVHRHCSASASGLLPNVLLNQCHAQPGDSGSAILLLRGNGAFIIGLSTASIQDKQTAGGSAPRMSLGPSAASFSAAVANAMSQ